MHTSQPAAPMSNRTTWVSRRLCYLTMQKIHIILKISTNKTIIYPRKYTVDVIKHILDTELSHRIRSTGDRPPQLRHTRWIAGTDQSPKIQHHDNGQAAHTLTMSKRKLPDTIPTDRVAADGTETPVSPPRAVVPKGSPADAFLQASPPSPESTVRTISIATIQSNSTTVNADLRFTICAQGDMEQTTYVECSCHCRTTNQDQSHNYQKKCCTSR